MSQSIDFFKIVIYSILPEISVEALEYLVQGTQVKNLTAKDYIIRTKKVHKEVSFLASGLVRGYLVDQNGNEITTRLIQKGGFATHYKAFLNQEPSMYAFQCLQDSTFVCFDYNHIQKGYKKFSELERFGRLVAESIVRTLENRIESFHFQSAEERYLNFIKTFPGLFNDISLTHLSSYLGITRPSLSRIRGQLS